MEALSTFLDMGGYAAFVWPSFGVTALVLVGLLMISLRFLRVNEATLAGLQVEEESGGAAADASGET